MTTTYNVFPFQSFIPAYVNGLKLSVASNTTLGVATGTILDSTGTYQLQLTTAATINAANTGLNGIDAGTFAASTVYGVFLVSDPVSLQPTGCMISTSFTTPTLPFGYSAYALVGYATTDVSTHFLPGYYTAGPSGGRRLFMYDAPQATSVTAGTSTTYTAINLETLVPLTSLRPVWITSALTPGAAGRQLFMQPQQATGDAVIVTGQVTATVVTSNNLLYANSNTTHMSINYKVSNAGDAAAIKVAGYEFFI